MIVPNPAASLRLVIQKKEKSFHNLHQTLEETTIASAWVTCGGGKRKPWWQSNPPRQFGVGEGNFSIKKKKKFLYKKNQTTYVSLTTNSPPLFFPVDLSEYCLGYKSIATINCCPLIRKTSNPRK